jgi:hypothetical protein
LLNQVHSKQEIVLQDLIEQKIDVTWNRKFKNIIDFLKDQSKFDEFKTQIILKGLVENKFNRIFQKKLPTMLSIDFINRISDEIKNVLTTLETFKIPEETSFKVEFEEQQLEEIESFYDEMLNLLEEIEKEKEIYILKFIMTESYQNTIKRLQAVSYLISLNVLKLEWSSEEEILESGKYKASVMGNHTTLFQENSTENPENDKSIILGISFNEWQQLKPFLQQDDFKGRPELKLLG